MTITTDDYKLISEIKNETNASIGDVIEFYNCAKDRIFRTDTHYFYNYIGKNLVKISGSLKMNGDCVIINGVQYDVRKLRQR